MSRQALLSSVRPITVWQLKETEKILVACCDQLAIFFGDKIHHIWMDLDSDLLAQILDGKRSLSVWFCGIHSRQFNLRTGTGLLERCDQPLVDATLAQPGL